MGANAYDVVTHTSSHHQRPHARASETDMVKHMQGGIGRERRFSEGVKGPGAGSKSGGNAGVCVCEKVHGGGGRDQVANWWLSEGVKGSMGNTGSRQ